MKQFDIKSREVVATIVIEDNGNYTIKSGAKIGTLKKLTDKQALNARLSNPDNPTTKDLVFTSASAAASFLQGSTIGGHKYFAKYLGDPIDITETKKEETIKEEQTPIDPSKLKYELCNKIATYCIDFAFKPDPRFLDTLIDVKDIDNFFLDTMALTGYPDDLLSKARDKFASPEWKEIKKELSKIVRQNDKINKRLAIYYGSAGTGKTTTALKEYPSAVKIVGSASQDPDDLFTRFDPSSKDYVLTEIGNAMINGLPLVVDEGNLFNQVVWQRLQGCLDNSTKISDRNIELTIKDGFKIIVTMNLETNLGKTPLPNPVVSRAMEIRNFDTDTFNMSLAHIW